MGPRMGPINRPHKQPGHKSFQPAFEKTTQIAQMYRYLRARHTIKPIFLYRNLSYMRDRIRRTNKSRRTFKVDNLLSTAIASKLSESAGGKVQSEFMTLMFLGFFDKTLSDDEVEVETFVRKVAHKKRKNSFETSQERFGRSLAKINPDTSWANAKISTVSIPTDDLRKPELRHLISVYLRLKVKVLEKIRNNIEDESRPKRYKSNDIVYESQLLVCDKEKRLPDGEYEISLHDTQPTTKISAELRGIGTFMSILKENSFKDYDRSPKLKFYLAWTKKKCDDLVDRQSVPSLKNNKSNQEPLVDVQKSTENTRIIYQFTFNNNSRQQLDPCENFCCIWCDLDCMALYSLMKHLMLCHTRFQFKYVPLHPTIRIDITINELYDASSDPVGSSSLFTFSRGGRLKRNFSEFLEIDENEFNGQRPFIAGHTRPYHHGMTCLPIHPNDADVDSEDENDTAWLQQKTKAMIEDFIDLNEGEKEMMKLWNDHLLKHRYVANSQIPSACDRFIEDKGKELLQKNLYRNFLLHLCSLFDYGFLSPEDYRKSVQTLQKLLNDYDGGRTVISDARKQQLMHWDQCCSQKYNQFIEQKRIGPEVQTATTGMHTSDDRS